MTMETAALIGMALIVLYAVGALVLALLTAKSEKPKHRVSLAKLYRFSIRQKRCRATDHV